MCPSGGDVGRPHKPPGHDQQDSDSGASAARTRLCRIAATEAEATEKYEMPMPIIDVRALLLPLLDDSPIHLFGIACHMEWEGEVKEDATHTLCLDLMALENVAGLGRLDTPNLLKLLSLHDCRWKAVVEALDDKNLFSANKRWNGCTCNITIQACDIVIDHSKCQSLALKLTWSRKLWRFASLGDMGIAGGESAGGPTLELEAALDDWCGCCNRTLYSRTVTLDNLKGVVQRLPKTIEVSFINICGVVL